jgi:hypothetical protein
MDKKLSGLIGTAAALALCNACPAAAQAQTVQPPDLTVQSYADLLEPIPDAAALLKAGDMARPAAAGDIQPVQYHHHHHHHHYRRYYHHHHHHHHHHYRYYWR